MADKLIIKRMDLDGKKLKVTIILPYFNEKIGLELLSNCQKELLKNNVKNKNIKIVRVAGCLEIPFACKKLIKKADVIIALGIVIKGETKHFDLVTETTYQALMQIQLEKMKPIIFGVLACNTLKQAEKRVKSNGLNKGKEAALAALIQSKI